MFTVDQVGAWRPLRAPVRPSSGVRPTEFQRLVATHALALAGDTLVTLALAGSLFFSISPNAARGRVGLSLFLTMAPFAVVAPLLGPAIDRSRTGRRAMVVGSCAGRAVACLVMVPVLDGLLLFPVAFSVLVLAKSYSVAKSALVPSAVSGATELVEANAKLAITGIVAGFLIAGPGVLVLRLLDARWVLRFAAVLFVAAAVRGVFLGSGVIDGEPGPPEEKDDAPVGGWGLAAAAFVMALLRAEVGFLTFLVAFGFRRAGAPSWWFGVVLASSMAGTLAGSVIAPRLRERVPEERILAASLALVAVVGFGTARIQGRLWAAAVAAGVGLAAGAGKLAFDAMVQRDAPVRVRARSFARFEAGFQLAWVAGALLPVIVATPLRQGYDVIGAGALAAGVAYVVVVRSRRAG